MIQVNPVDLPAEAQDKLRQYQAEIDSNPEYPDRVAAAKKQFAARNTKNNPTFQAVKTALESMCSGAKRCMYCEDSAADEVEHFRPKDLYPELVFVWENYLYSCGPCNGPKNNRFAVIDAADNLVEVTRKREDPIVPPISGQSALIDPRVEDPTQFIILDVDTTFEFMPFPGLPVVERKRADYTIRVLRLNERDFLIKARKEAFDNYRARLGEYVTRKQAGAPEYELARYREDVKTMQHPTVWRQMKRFHARIPKLNQLFTQAPEALNW